MMKVINEIKDSNGIYHAETGISLEEWQEMLSNGTITERQKEILLFYYREPLHEGIPNMFAKKHGGSSNLYMNPIWQLGKNVQSFLNRFTIHGIDQNGIDTNENVYWSIPMDGKKEKNGFMWRVKPELCDALEKFLYLELLDAYKKRRKSISLIDDDELYKWKIIDSCSGKDGLLLLETILSQSHNNLMTWRHIDKLKKLLEKSEFDLESLLNSLFDEKVDLQIRISSFLQSMKEQDLDIDERTVSVLLACRYPDKYPFYKDSYYSAFCTYLGNETKKAWEKYIHYTEKMQPLLDLVKKDDELHQILSDDVGSLYSSDVLIAQDVVYTIFERNIINPYKNKDMFDWIPFYTELAHKLLNYKNNPAELAKTIYDNFDREKEIKFLHDEGGADFTEIDPFTVFSIMNRTMNNRSEIIQKIKEVFKLESTVPSSYEGLPTQHSMSASFYCFKKDRTPDGKDLERLWDLFELALENDADLENAFDGVLKQKSIAIAKLTMGLFYISPYKFLALDSNNRAYLEKYGLEMKNFNTMKYTGYKSLLQQVNDMMSKNEIIEKDYPEFSANAYGGIQSEDGTDSDYYLEIADLLRFKKNIIIEGAPGIGKTFELPRIITRLCYPELSNAPQNLLDSKFQFLKENHQVEYVTFHQSMDYEEFVEGIRPHTNEEGNVVYVTESGIFKKICEHAKSPIVEENKLKIKGDASIWKVSLAGTGENPVRSECMKNGHIRIGWDSLGEDLSQVEDPHYEGKVILNAFYDRMQIGDIVFSCYSSRSIDAIGVVTGEPEWHNEYDGYKRVRKVEWLIKGINEDIYEINGQTSMTLGTVYRLNNITLDHVFDILNKYGVSKPTEVKKNNLPYVLVIDEINRGNVSKIFGELITLLEPDKRIGKQSETEVILPYSKEHFAIPDNVYIIGTMNTADRSLDTLDYAMRRRFGFVKFTPIALEIDGFNSELFEMVSKLFIDNYDEYRENSDVIIKPSTCLADDVQPADVWIGQSYFLMNDENGIDKTYLKIKYEIIPILEEYLKDGVFKDEEQVKEVIAKLIEYSNAEADS